MKRLALLALLALSSSAAAQAPRRALDVAVSAPPCIPQPIPTDSLFQSLGLELAPQRVTVVPDGSASSWPRLRITIARCDGSAATVQLEDASGLRTERREVDLHDVDVVTRPRVLALAAAEAVRQTRVFEPPPAPPPLPAPDPAPPLAPLVGVVAGVRVFGVSQLLLGGAETHVAVPITRWLELGGRAALGFGGEQDSLGSIHVTVLTFAAGPRFVARPAAWFALSLGPELEAGMAWARGDARATTTTERSGRGGVAVLDLSAQLRAAVTPHTWLVVGMTGGGVLAGVSGYADGREVATLQGLTFGTSLGVARSF